MSGREQQNIRKLLGENKKIMKIFLKELLEFLEGSTKF